MTCEDCGAEAARGLCACCTAFRVKGARAAAVRNAKLLTEWALENTHGPGEALLSLMTAFMLIHATSADVLESPLALWVARAHEVLLTMAPEAKG